MIDTLTAYSSDETVCVRQFAPLPQRNVRISTASGALAQGRLSLLALAEEVLGEGAWRCASSTDSPVPDRRVLRDRLAELGRECAERDWDGYGAEPLTPDVIRKAEQFAGTIPTDIPAPEVVPEPDGELAFEWRPSARRSISISVSKDGRLAWVAFLGDRARFRGSQILGDASPVALTTLIRQLLSE